MKIEKTYKVAQNGLSDELLSVGESSLFQVLVAISEPSAFIFWNSIQNPRIYATMRQTKNDWSQAWKQLLPLSEKIKQGL